MRLLFTFITLSIIFYSFISFFKGLDRSQFDNKTVSFEDHIRHEHNMWHYLYFMVLVRVKDPAEFSGPESYVYAMVKVTVLIIPFQIALINTTLTMFFVRKKTWIGSLDCVPSHWQPKEKSRSKTSSDLFKFSWKLFNLRFLHFPFN